MNCLVCGEVIKEGKKFCTQCGAPVGEGANVEGINKETADKEITTCIACEKQIKTGAKFCNYCGSAQVEVKHPQIEESGTEFGEENSEEVYKQEIIGEEKVKQGNNRSNQKQYKQGALLGIGVVGIIAIGIGISSVIGKQNEKGYKQVYEDYKGKGYIRMDKGEFVEIDATGEVRISHDGKVIFYQEDNELYYIKAGEREQELSDEVLSYQISKDGKKVIYIEGKNWGERVGKLIYHTVGKGETIIEKESYIRYNTLSPNGKYVAYVTGIDVLEEVYGKAKGKLYTQTGENIALSNINKVYQVNNKGMVLGKKVKSDSTLYEREIGDVYLENGKESTKIASNIADIRATPSLNKIYMIDEKGKLQCYEKNKLTVIADQVVYMSFEKVNENQMTLMYADEKGRLNIILDNGITCKVGDEQDIFDVRYSLDHKRIMYRKADDLYYGVKSNSDFKVQRIAKDVSQWEMTLDGKKGIYIADDQLFSFEGTKEPKSIEDDVKLAKISERGDIWFIDKKDNLWYTDGKKEPKEIFEEVDEINTPRGNKIGVLNQDGEFYEFEKAKQLEELADDVVYIENYLYQEGFWENY